jgi:catalase (peroxidase I)
MNKELLAKLRKTESVKLSGGVVRTLDDAELNSVVGGMRRLGTSSDSISGGIYDDCVD